jgi:3-isopropylmalate/(R)-2-methylmalate dehydratase small subunit
VTVSQSEIETLQLDAETQREITYTVDLVAKTLSWGERKVACEIPETHRQALLHGTWDSTAMLVANLDKVRRVANNLPYINRFKT